MSSNSRLKETALPVVHIIVATILLIAADAFFGAGAFTFPTTLLMVGFSILISVVAFVFYAVFAILLCVSCGFNHPGFGFATLLGTIAGAVSLRLLSYFFPDLLAFTVFSAVLYSVANTFLVWGLGYVSGSFKSGFPKFGPTRRSTT